MPGTHTRDTKNMKQLLARHTRNTTVSMCSLCV